MRLKLIIIAACLLTFLIISNFNYEEIKGVSGNGYKLGFALSTESIICLIILLVTIPAYFTVKRLNSKTIKSNKD